MGVPLVNQNGRTDNRLEPSCWPLDRWNFVMGDREDTPEAWNKFYAEIIEEDKVDQLLLDVDMTIPTEHLEQAWADPLEEIKPFLTRSCILKWNSGARFMPHVDTWHPVRWLRLWGTTNPEGMYLRYKGEDTTSGFCMWNDITKEDEVYNEAPIEIEAGRLYLHDSMIWHDALAFEDNVYQFFISIHPRAYDFLLQSFL